MNKVLLFLFWNIDKGEKLRSQAVKQFFLVSVAS